MCVFGAFFHAGREDCSLNTRSLGRDGERDQALSLVNTPAFDAGNDAKRPGNAAVSKFTFCIQGFALFPCCCSFLRGLKAVLCLRSVE